MRGMKMDHNSADHVWNKLQAQIDQMFGRNRRDSLNLIEHRPQHGQLLSMSLDDGKDDPEIS
ncbi:MAG: hypothetical protein ABFD12_12570 [Syntrophorhabdus sp.]